MFQIVQENAMPWLVADASQAVLDCGTAYVRGDLSKAWQRVPEDVDATS